MPPYEQKSQRNHQHPIHQYRFHDTGDCDLQTLRTRSRAMAVLSASAEPFRVRLVQLFHHRGHSAIHRTHASLLRTRQLINTPLVALFICLYRHFVMSSLVESNRFSLSNYLETLVIIAFLSFAIGLYWRFKFRSKYLAMELEETRLLNDELKEMQEKSLLSMSSDNPIVDTNVNSEVHKQDISTVNEVKEMSEKPRLQELTLTGTTSESVTLQISHLLYIEAVGNYMKVCHLRNEQVRTDMLRATMKQMEETLQDYPMIVRCHRAFLVNLGQVEQIVSHSGSIQLLIKHCHESLPVSRSNMAQIKTAIKGL